MKKIILLFLMTLLFFMAEDAQSQEECVEDFCCADETDFYAKISSGVNFLQNTKIDGNKASYQPGYIISGSFGYSWRYGLCLEFEYAFRRNAIRKIHFFSDDSSMKFFCHNELFIGWKKIKRFRFFKVARRIS